MKVSPSKPQKGFTIIEVLIVLAAAGMIMAIVFQAIPALQRSSRNSQRKQDVAAILSAVSSFGLNNSGSFPPDCGAGTSCESTTDSPVRASKLKFYDIENIRVESKVLGVTVSAQNNVERVGVYNRHRCSSSVTGAATQAGAGYNDVVALYALESGSNTPTAQCQQL